MVWLQVAGPFQGKWRVTWIQTHTLTTAQVRVNHPNPHYTQGYCSAQFNGEAFIQMSAAYSASFLPPKNEGHWLEDGSSQLNETLSIE